MNYKPAVILLVLSVLSILPLGAEDLEHCAEVATTERMHFAPGGTIRVTDSFGYLSVDGWDEPSVELTVIKSTNRFYRSDEQEEAKRRTDLIRVETEHPSAAELSIITHYASRNHNFAPPLSNKTKAGVTLEYRIRAPHESRLVIHHNSGYVWVNDVSGDIEATSHTGDMIVMLPSPASYSIDARSRLGSVTSDFAGAVLRQFVLGSRFARAGEGPSRHVYLRMGRGSITIKQIPPAWYPKGD
jgi:hypothetical protein